jgi:hypothetical protein
MTGSAADVAAAWDALRPAVIQAFSAPTTTRTDAKRGASEDGPPGADRPTGVEVPQPKARRTRTAARAPRATGRADVIQRLMDAPLENFPELGDEPAALLAGYATLKWAHDALELEDLQIGELHAFLNQRLRIPHTANAYRNAFANNPRAVHGVGRPAAFRLMTPGEKTLRTYLQQVEAGASASDAEAQARSEVGD